MEELINDLLKYRSPTQPSEQQTHTNFENLDPTNPKNFEYIDKLFNENHNTQDSRDGVGVPYDNDTFLKIVHLDFDSATISEHPERGLYNKVEFEKESCIAFFAGKIGVGPQLFDYYITSNNQSEENEKSYGVFVFEKLDNSLQNLIDERIKVIYDKEDSYDYSNDFEEAFGENTENVVGSSASPNGPDTHFSEVNYATPLYTQGVTTPGIENSMTSFGYSFIGLLKKLLQHGIYHVDLHANNIFYKREKDGTKKWFVIDYGRVVLWNNYRKKINIKEHIPRWDGEKTEFTQEELMDQSLRSIRTSIAELYRDDVGRPLERYKEILDNFKKYVASAVRTPASAKITRRTDLSPTATPTTAIPRALNF